mgnify:CR=1 FL=1
MNQPTPLRITDVVVRDAHQSLLATRMRTEDLVPIAPAMDYMKLAVTDLGNMSERRVARLVDADSNGTVTIYDNDTPLVASGVTAGRGDCVVVTQESARQALDDAIEQFQVCLASEARSLDSLQMMATCALDLAWTAATPACGGPALYNVYRSTSPGFTPGPENRIAQGLSVVNDSVSAIR